METTVVYLNFTDVNLDLNVANIVYLSPLRLAK